MRAGAGPEGEDTTVMKLFNISAVPAMILYPVGQKVLNKGMVMDPQASAYLLQSPKLLYTQLSAFLPTNVQRVTQYSIDRFLTEV